MFQNFSGVDDGWWSVMSSSYSPTPLHLPNTLPIDPSESGDCKSSVSARLDERFNPSRSLNRRWMGQVYAKLNGPTFQLHTRSIRSLNYPTDSPSPPFRYTHFTHNGNAGGLVIAFFPFTSRFIGFSWAVAMIEDSVKNQPPLHHYIYICICTSSVFILDEFRPERSRAKLIKRQLIDSRERCGARLWLKIVNSNDRSAPVRQGAWYFIGNRATIDCASAPLEKSPVGMQPARTGRENAKIENRGWTRLTREASLLLSFIHRCICIIDGWIYR